MILQVVLSNYKMTTVQLKLGEFPNFDGIKHNLGTYQAYWMHLINGWSSKIALWCFMIGWIPHFWGKATPFSATTCPRLSCVKVWRPQETTAPTSVFFLWCIPMAVKALFGNWAAWLRTIIPAPRASPSYPFQGGFKPFVLVEVETYRSRPDSLDVAQQV